MRKSVLLFFGITLLTVIPVLGYAQSDKPHVNVGIKAGLNRYVLDGLINEESAYKSGMHAGVFLRWQLTPRVALQPEVNFSQQGSLNSSPYGVLPLKSTTRLSYLNVPVLLKVYAGKVLNLQVGPQLGVLLAARKEGQHGWRFTENSTEYITGNRDIKKDLRSDAGLVFGLGADLKNGLVFSARMNYGLRDINNSEDERRLRESLDIGGIHNRGFEFSAGYVFGSKRP